MQFTAVDTVCAVCTTFYLYTRARSALRARSRPQKQIFGSHSFSAWKKKKIFFCKAHFASNSTTLRYNPVPTASLRLCANANANVYFTAVCVCVCVAWKLLSQLLLFGYKHINKLKFSPEIKCVRNADMELFRAHKLHIIVYYIFRNAIRCIVKFQ